MLSEDIEVEVLQYSGYFGTPSRCGISNKGNVVIVHELKDNPGTSVTNRIEHLAEIACNKYNIKNNELILIEHYEKDSFLEEHYDIVNFEEKTPRFLKPSWKRITSEEVDNYLRGA